MTVGRLFLGYSLLAPIFGCAGVNLVGPPKKVLPEGRSQLVFFPPTDPASTTYTVVWAKAVSPGDEGKASFKEQARRVVKPDGDTRGSYAQIFSSLDRGRSVVHRFTLFLGEGIRDAEPIVEVVAFRSCYVVSFDPESRLPLQLVLMGDSLGSWFKGEELELRVGDEAILESEGLPIGPLAFFKEGLFDRADSVKLPALSYGRWSFSLLFGEPSVYAINELPVEGNQKFPPIERFRKETSGRCRIMIAVVSRAE